MSNTSQEYAKAYYSLEKDKAEGLNLLKDSLEIFSDEIYKFFNHPEISIESKKAIIEKSFEKSTFRDFLYVLLDNSRFDLLQSIKDDYESLLFNDNKFTRVKVYSKIILSDEYILSLKEKLKKEISNELIIENIIDESIIGGIRIEYDSEQIDLTLNKEFDELKKSLKV